MSMVFAALVGALLGALPLYILADARRVSVVVRTGRWSARLEVRR